MLNFNEYCPECAASFVTTVFWNPSFNKASFPPFGGSQYHHPVGTPTPVFQSCPAQPFRPVNRKSSAHTVPVAFFPPTNDTISVNALRGKIVDNALVSAIQLLLVAAVWSIGSFIVPIKVCALS